MNEVFHRMTRAIARISGINTFKWVDEKFSVRSAIVMGTPSDLCLHLVLGLAGIEEDAPSCDCDRCKKRREHNITSKTNSACSALLALGTYQDCVLDSSFYSPDSKKFHVKTRNTKTGKCQSCEGETFVEACLFSIARQLADTDPK
jgi:hypothetical protein